MTATILHGGSLFLRRFELLLHACWLLLLLFFSASFSSLVLSEDVELYSLEFHLRGNAKVCANESQAGAADQKSAFWHEEAGCSSRPALHDTPYMVAWVSLQRDHTLKTLHTHTHTQSSPRCACTSQPFFLWLVVEPLLLCQATCSLAEACLWCKAVRGKREKSLWRRARIGRPTRRRTLYTPLALSLTHR